MLISVSDFVKSSEGEISCILRFLDSIPPKLRGNPLEMTTSHTLKFYEQVKLNNI